MLTSLPPETLCLILDRLPKGALLSLRATCKAFLHAITPYVFSDVCFSLRDIDTHHRLKCLQSLSNPSCTIAPYVIKLHIERLYIYTYTFPSADSVLVNSLIPTVLSEYFPSFISRMRNLKTVCWTHDVDRDPSDYLISTAGALSSLPSLKTLIVKINDSLISKIPQSAFPPLRNFKNLCKLSVYFEHDIPRKYCLQEITTVINASPGLTDLSIHACVSTSKTVQCTSLQRFLQKSRPELAQLKLVYVPLPNAGIRDILSHKLQQLSVWTRPGRRDIEFDWGQLWSALRETGIKLSMLEVSGTENAIDKMFTYLLSYTGLQKLAVRELEMDTQEMEDKAGQRFWRKVIPHHRNSLTMLSIESTFESEWCYGPCAVPALRRCLSLRDLTISVCSVPLFWAKKKLSWARKHNKIEFHGLQEPDGAVENCGAWILSDINMPLEKLRLMIAGLATCRTESIDHLNRNARILSSPRGYREGIGRNKRLRTRINEVLLGIRAPAAKSTNWPSVVQTD
ncbi:hypothetical protein V8E54_009065, partial [Elaphomyces granulatus]